MEFSYRFPVVRGIQANNEYYIAMVPLKMIARLFPSDEEYVAPEYRAQRKLNVSRIPVMCKYITDNRTTMFFLHWLHRLMETTFLRLFQKIKILACWKFQWMQHC